MIVKEIVVLCMLYEFFVVRSFDKLLIILSWWYLGWIELRLWVIKWNVNCGFDYYGNEDGFNNDLNEEIFDWVDFGNEDVVWWFKIYE